MILGHHLIVVGYGHWMPNDIRGSYSRRVASPELDSLAEIHLGRKEVQPSAEQLKTFLKKAERKLDFPLRWWNENDRLAIADSIATWIQTNRLICYAAAILPNHIHLLVRRHCITGQTMLTGLRDTVRLALAAPTEKPHPIVSSGGADWFQSSKQQLMRTMDYIHRNPPKHRLPEQNFPFLTPYDGWPHRRVDPMTPPV